MGKPAPAATLAMRPSAGPMMTSMSRSSSVLRMAFDIVLRVWLSPARNCSLVMVLLTSIDDNLLARVLLNNVSVTQCSATCLVFVELETYLGEARQHGWPR